VRRRQRKKKTLKVRGVIRVFAGGKRNESKARLKSGMSLDAFFKEED